MDSDVVTFHKLTEAEEKLVGQIEDLEFKANMQTTLAILVGIGFLVASLFIWIGVAAWHGFTSGPITFIFMMKMVLIIFISIMIGMLAWAGHFHHRRDQLKAGTDQLADYQTLAALLDKLEEEDDAIGQYVGSRSALDYLREWHLRSAGEAFTESGLA